MQRTDKRRLVTAVLTVLVLVLGGLVATATRHTPGPTRYLTDSQGRALFLHGLNTSGSAKSDPDGLPWITEEDVQAEYDAMGTNFVRLLIQWQALEPEEGVYDEAYLDAVDERVEWYADRGYHVLLDMHQDLYGRYTSPEEHSGNGAPEWATHNDGLRVESQETWELVYLEPGVVRAFDHFWGTTGEHPELMDAYADAWGHVAARFSGNPAVIGYDLMNEPFGGSLQGADFEAGPLAELYRRCMERIRLVDQESWIFLEGQAVGVNWGLPSSLPHLDDPREGEPRIAYAPHMYALPMDLGQPYEGEAKERIDSSVDLWSHNVRLVGERMEAPIVLGEFGLDMSGAGAPEFVRRMLEETEAMASGRVYWSNDHDGWGPWESREEGEELTPGPLADVMNRAYPRTVAGDPLELGYDDASATLSVRYTERSEVSGATELYLPEDVFGAGPGAGFELTVDTPGGRDAWTSRWDERMRVLHVTVPGSADGEVTTLTVAPE
ncbi:cellulase family glycosylhydrolase [Nocardiopsis ganjiahuensis]|uniref:cellulase family glycosylhydrolase n=1 Tax=Nocardiopsis ganjiahuensis TaxID=239984 RepID=UPI00034B1C63|nr:cellulase family glycosylhydrolase [Nocardiopsis ganjiahuensis]